MTQFPVVADPFAAQRARHAVGRSTFEAMAQSVSKDTPPKKKKYADRSPAAWRTRSVRKLAGTKVARQNDLPTRNRESRDYSGNIISAMNPSLRTERIPNHHLRFVNIMDFFPVPAGIPAPKARWEV